jgi:hypothetical protein
MQGKIILLYSVSEMRLTLQQRECIYNTLTSRTMKEADLHKIAKNILYSIYTLLEYTFPLFCGCIYIYSRSQRPCGLRHELSSLAGTLGSWVQIPLKARMSVCAFILCLCSMCRYRPCDGLITRPSSPTVCIKKDYETEEEARAQQNAVQPLMNELMNTYI